jgi:hypothetical protein
MLSVKVNTFILLIILYFSQVAKIKKIILIFSKKQNMFHLKTLINKGISMYDD